MNTQNNAHTKLIAALLALLLCLAQAAQAQAPEQEGTYEGGKVVELKDTSFHSPGRAALLSAIIPGAGQIYNQRYWKLPLIYGGGIAFAYFIQSNNFRWDLYGNAYNARMKMAEADLAMTKLDQTSPTYDADKQALENERAAQEAKVPEQFKNLPVDRLQYYRNSYRRDTQYFIILTVLFYGINIIDAAVDAHFFTYDISNDLSLRVEPCVNSMHASFGNGGLKVNPNLGLHLSITF
ncbi:MAG: DUF5683 domain-containing protein [Prevotellaceae bacterium]|nr:DUF5683 domain-containing protein [Prevotellaceae bacterium]